MKVVIIAGGKGTRISTVNSEIPKAMIPVAGKPVLEYQIEMAKRNGYTEFIFIIGHLGEQVENYFGNGCKWGVQIDYYKETIPLGTAGALFELKDQLTEDFFVFYGDTVMDFAMNMMLEFHRLKKADITLFLHPNDHPYDSDLVLLNQNKQVDALHLKPHPEGLICKNIVNAAVFIFTSKILTLFEKGKKYHIEKDVLPYCIEKGLKVFGYVSPEYIKDMGTPDRYEKVCNDMLSGKVASQNRKYKRKAIFLDRDGVINKEVNLLSKVEQLELIEGVSEAISYINHKGYLAIVVTNQPVIARNLCSVDELNYIHDYLETKLGEGRAYLDAIYYCPHHPDAGYQEERKEYKIVCNCRKPKPGMILQAANDWNIDLFQSYMIGDRESDILGGENAGVKQSVLIETNKPFALLETIQSLI